MNGQHWRLIYLLDSVSMVTLEHRQCTARPWSFALRYREQERRGNSDVVMGLTLSAVIFVWKRPYISTDLSSASDRNETSFLQSLLPAVGERISYICMYTYSALPMSLDIQSFKVRPNEAERRPLQHRTSPHVSVLPPSLSSSIVSAVIIVCTPTWPCLGHALSPSILARLTDVALSG